MKKVRIMSNLIADELKMALDESGIQVDEDVFEGQVSDIVEMVSESVKKAACKNEGCEDCDDEEECDDVEDEEDIDEDGVFYYAVGSNTLGGVDVGEGEFVIFTDTEDGKILADIYDVDGEIKDEAVEVTPEEKEAFLETAEELEDGYDYEDDEELLEAISLHKRSSGEKRARAKKERKNSKKRETKKAKEGYIRQAIRKGGKVVKYVLRRMTQAEKKARQKIGKALGTKGQRFKKNESCTVKEGFDISVNGAKLALQEGDEVTFNEGAITVIREGVVIFSNVQVSENFMDKCFEEAVLEKKCCEEDEEEKKEAPTDAEAEKEDVDAEAAEEEDPEDKDDDEDDDKDVEECGSKKVSEGAMLTFKANKGFVFVAEGTELPMGNRIRARATLTAKGYNVTSEMLDNASNGKVVVL